MLPRSVPFYGQAQRMIGEIAADFAIESTRLYDLGCSTGITLLTLDPVVPAGVFFIGVEILERVKAKLAQAGFKRAPVRKAATASRLKMQFGRERTAVSNSSRRGFSRAAVNWEETISNEKSTNAPSGD